MPSKKDAMIVLGRHLNTDLIDHGTGPDAAKAVFSPPPFLGPEVQPAVDPQDDAKDEFEKDIRDEGDWAAN